MVDILVRLVIVDINYATIAFLLVLYLEKMEVRLKIFSTFTPNEDIIHNFDCINPIHKET